MIRIAPETSKTSKISTTSKPLASRAARTVAALVAAATLSVAVAPSAQAGGWRKHHSYGAAALGGGLLLGAIIASNSRPAYAYARDCWLETRKRYDDYGRRYFVKVRVCD